MVVHYLDIMGITVLPTEADAPLVIDAYAVLPSPITRELLKTVTGRRAQVHERCGGIQHLQLPFRGFAERLEGERTIALIQGFGMPVAEAFYRLGSIYRVAVIVKR